VEGRLGQVDAPKFSGTQTYGNNDAQAIYVFPKREACLMALSYSYELQAKVFNSMTALEGSPHSRGCEDEMALGVDSYGSSPAACSVHFGCHLQ